MNDSAVQMLGDVELKTIARGLLDGVKQNASIDWTQKQSVQANLRRRAKRVLRKYKYPPDKDEVATQTVLQRAERRRAGRDCGLERGAAAGVCVGVCGASQMRVVGRRGCWGDIFLSANPCTEPAHVWGS